MSDQEGEDSFGGAELSDSGSSSPEAPSAPGTPTHSDDNGTEDAGAQPAAEAEAEAEEERVVLPRCPDVVGAYQSLSTMRLPRVVRTVAEPYTRAGFVAAQKRAGGSLADAERELLAIRWRRANGRTESNARLVRWSDGTAQILVGASRVLDVIPRSGGTTLHVGVKIAPSVTQDLGFPTVGYLASVPRDEVAKLRRLAAADRAATGAAGAAADADADADADGLEGGLEDGLEDGEEAAIIAECQSSASSDDDDNSDSDDAGDFGAPGDKQARAQRARAAVTLAAEALDAAGDAAARRQKSVAEQGHELARALAAKEQRLRRRTGGVLEPSDLAGSDDDEDDDSDGRGDEDRAAERLQRAKRQSLHGRR